MEIKTEEQYQATLKVIEMIMDIDPAKGSTWGKVMTDLVELVEDWERKRYG